MLLPLFRVEIVLFRPNIAHCLLRLRACSGEINPLQVPLYSFLGILAFKIQLHLQIADYAQVSVFLFYNGGIVDFWSLERCCRIFNELFHPTVDHNR